MKSLYQKRSAFTQIELIFVIIIIAILGSIAMSKLTATRDDAKLSADISNMGVCLSDAGSTYVATGVDLTEGSSRACDDVKCYNITYSVHGSNFIVETNATAADYCSEIDIVGDHLARTYQFSGTRIKK